MVRPSSSVRYRLGASRPAGRPAPMTSMHVTRGRRRRCRRLGSHRRTRTTARDTALRMICPSRCARRWPLFHPLIRRTRRPSKRAAVLADSATLGDAPPTRTVLTLRTHLLPSVRDVTGSTAPRAPQTQTALPGLRGRSCSPSPRAAARPSRATPSRAAPSSCDRATRGRRPATPRPDTARSRSASSALDSICKPPRSRSGRSPCDSSRLRSVVRTSKRRQRLGSYLALLYNRGNGRSRDRGPRPLICERPSPRSSPSGR
mmetsp:Transcript_8546/g.24299  ORF Transcript_8546/g.24299 Transcript_8546/m.24299 type:complete len:260 (+) Transcript_8546:368-1147(+)